MPEFRPKTDKTCALCGEEKNIFSFQQYDRAPIYPDTKSTWLDVCHCCTRRAVEAVLNQQVIHPGEHSFHKQQIQMGSKIY